jgi:hypothetical protein
VHVFSSRDPTPIVAICSKPSLSEVMMPLTAKHGETPVLLPKETLYIFVKHTAFQITEPDMPRIPSGKASTNEVKYPYITELAVAGKGLDVGLSRRIMDFHTRRHIQPRHGRSTFYEGEGQAYYRWCFSDLATAESFIEQFGGTIIQRKSA